MKSQLSKILALALLWTAIAAIAWFCQSQASYNQAIQSRAVTGQQIALHVRDLVMHNRISDLQAAVDSYGTGNKSIASIVIRALPDSKPIACFGEHNRDTGSTNETLQQSFRLKGQRGRSSQLEICYRPVSNHALLSQLHGFVGGFLESPQLLTAFLAALGTLLTSLLMSRLGVDIKKAECVNHSAFAVESIANAVCVCDTQGVIEFCNSAAERILGLPKGRLVGRSIDSFDWTHDLSLPGKHPWELTRETGQRVGGRLVLNNPDQKSFTLEVVSEAKTVEGRIVNIVTSLLNVAEFSALPGNRRTEQAAASTEQPSLDDKDFRTPLNTILGYTDILCHDRAVEAVDRKQYFESIKASCHQILSYRDNKGIHHATSAKADAVDLTARFAQLSRLNILIVDDCQTTRELAGVYLAKVGSKFDYAATGQEAFDKATGSQFDLILMDIHMPKMDGIQTLRQLREFGQMTPVLAWTAFIDNVTRAACLKSGFSSILTKPFLRKDLYREILACIPESQLAATPSLAKPTVSESATNQTINTPTAPPELVPDDSSEDINITSALSDTLDAKLAQLVQACSAEDFKTLTKIGHWLKGTAPTVGFDELGTVAAELQQSANSHSLDGCVMAVKNILTFASQIKLEGTPNTQKQV